MGTVTTSVAPGLLLDTHAALWAVNDPDRLGRDAREHLEKADQPVFVSAVTAWELSTKHRQGRLPEAESWLPRWDAQLTRMGARSLPVTTSHALLAGGLDWVHRDPFDRMLAAQAVIEGLTLVTRDRAFESFPERVGHLRLLWQGPPGGR